MCGFTDWLTQCKMIQDYVHLLQKFDLEHLNISPVQEILSCWTAWIYYIHNVRTSHGGWLTLEFISYVYNMLTL